MVFLFCPVKYAQYLVLVPSTHNGIPIIMKKKNSEITGRCRVRPSDPKHWVMTDSLRKTFLISQPKQFQVS